MNYFNFFSTTEVIFEQTDRDPASPEDIRVLQATRGESSSAYSKDVWQIKGKQTKQPNNIFAPGTSSKAPLRGTNSFS